MEKIFCVVESNSWQVPNLRDPTVHMIFIGSFETGDKELDKMTNKRGIIG